MIENHIHYVDDGPNVARNHINIKCPFCGYSDPSEHMGLDLETGYWGCWRDSEHRGKSPVKLIAKLLNCSFVQAMNIVGEDEEIEIDDFGKLFEKIQKPKIQEAKPRLVFPPTFKPITTTDTLADRFVTYLNARGFELEDIDDLAYNYDLHYCLTGFWKNRIIVPIYLDGELVSWTGRSIHFAEDLRYMSLSKEQSRVNIKHTLFNHTWLRHGSANTLFITEGPFDALKVDFYGRAQSINATCLFGLSITSEQISLLSEIQENFNKIYLLMDEGALVQTLELQSRLVGLVDGAVHLPEGISDPGELTKNQVQTILAAF